ncbi:MAG TPA: hypothetical protein VF520_13160 [Thermoleophilaceae bacterium]|jgi:hypothetical protein
MDDLAGRAHSGKGARATEGRFVAGDPLRAIAVRFYNDATAMSRARSSARSWRATPAGGPYIAPLLHDRDRRGSPRVPVDNRRRLARTRQRVMHWLRDLASVPDSRMASLAVMLAVGAAVTVLISTLTFRFFERPFLRLRRGWRDRPAAAAARA